MQTPAEFDDFCLVMEEWYADSLGPEMPRLFDDSYVFHVYQATAISLRTAGKTDSKLGFVIMALEQAGIPPKKAADP